MCRWSTVHSQTSKTTTETRRCPMRRPTRSRQFCLLGNPKQNRYSSSTANKWSINAVKKTRCFWSFRHGQESLNFLMRFGIRTSTLDDLFFLSRERERKIPVKRKSTETKTSTGTYCRMNGNVPRCDILATTTLDPICFIHCVAFVFLFTRCCTQTMLSIGEAFLLKRSLPCKPFGPC